MAAFVCQVGVCADHLSARGVWFQGDKVGVCQTVTDHESSSGSLSTPNHRAMTTGDRPLAGGEIAACSPARRLHGALLRTWRPAWSTSPGLFAARREKRGRGCQRNTVTCVSTGLPMRRNQSMDARYAAHVLCTTGVLLHQATLKRRVACRFTREVATGLPPAHPALGCAAAGRRRKRRRARLAQRCSQTVCSFVPFAHTRSYGCNRQLRKGLTRSGTAAATALPPSQSP
jgi:hypothetical protein